MPLVRDSILEESLAEETKLIAFQSIHHSQASEATSITTSSILEQIMLEALKEAAAEVHTQEKDLVSMSEDLTKAAVDQ